jgi:hypothetical protein
MRIAVLLALLLAPALAAGFLLDSQRPGSSPPDASRLQAMAARFAPFDIGADISNFPPRERQALSKLVQANWVIDGLFLRQVWAGNPGMLMGLQKDGSQLGRERLHYFLINKGPWSRLDSNSVFIPGAPEKPEAANYSPPGASRAEIEAWVKTLSEADRAQATGFFTVIRRRAEETSRFTIIPYNVEYQGDLAVAAGLLNEAAALTAQPTLKAFLSARADAFLSNDYYRSDVAWMDLDSTIEPTIGPYEVYEDELFNYKAGFEAYVTVRDDAETAKLKKLGNELQDVENSLPIDAKYRNPKLGASAPIRVVNEILAAGDGNHGVQTAAFNLPNDERVIREKGSKRVMLRNVQDAKFRVALVPISQKVLAPASQKNVSFDAFFTHTVMHELMHGLGPHDIEVGGRKTTVRQELKETYSAFEEAKADISGLFALQHLVNRGVLDKNLQQTMYETFLASAFRSIRFGVNEAHGRGVALQLNYLLDYGAFRQDGDGIYSVDHAKIRDGVSALAREMMTLQAEGNYTKVKEMLSRLAVVRPEVQKALDRLSGIPVDIEPKYPTAERLLAELVR